MKSSWQPLVCAAFAVLTLAAVDLSLQHLVPVDRKREAADGLAQLRESDPEVLVVGSSHARTFHVLGEQLASLTGRRTPLVAVPLENGKLVPYEWLLVNRIAPMLDASGPAGTQRYPSLRRFILLTEWWDSCPHADGLHWNLPSRAWAFQDFVAYVLENGLDSYSRNYPQYKFRRLLALSTLARDRSEPRIKRAVSRVQAGLPVEMTQEEFRSSLQEWQAGVEKGVECIGAREHMAALARMLDFATTRGLESTVVLFPRMPGTLTDRAKATTLAAFRDAVQSIAAARNVKVVDLTWQSPLQDGDFMADFDHVNATGNLKFARWALQNDLSFLLQPPTQAVAAGNRLQQSMQ